MPNLKRNECLELDEKKKEKLKKVLLKKYGNTPDKEAKTDRKKVVIVRNSSTTTTLKPQKPKVSKPTKILNKIKDTLSPPKKKKPKKKKKAPKICTHKNCTIQFPSSSTSLYCPSCRVEIRLESVRANARKRYLENRKKPKRVLYIPTPCKTKDCENKCKYNRKYCPDCNIERISKGNQRAKERFDKAGRKENVSKWGLKNEIPFSAQQVANSLGYSSSYFGTGMRKELRDFLLELDPLCPRNAVLKHIEIKKNLLETKRELIVKALEKASGGQVEIVKTLERDGVFLCRSSSYRVINASIAKKDEIRTLLDLHKTKEVIKTLEKYLL